MIGLVGDWNKNGDLMGFNGIDLYIYTILVGGDWNHGIVVMTFHSVGNVIIPTDFHSIIFQRGRAQPPTSLDFDHVFWFRSLDHVYFSDFLRIWGMGSDSISHQDGSAGCLMCWTQESYVVTRCYSYGNLSVISTYNPIYRYL